MVGQSAENLHSSMTNISWLDDTELKKINEQVKLITDAAALLSAQTTSLFFESPASNTSCQHLLHNKQDGDNICTNLENMFIAHTHGWKFCGAFQMYGS